MDKIQELFEKYKNTTVQKAMEVFAHQRDYIIEKSGKDTVRSAAYYAAFKTLAREFEENVKERQFPILTDYLWGYEVMVGNISISLCMVKYEYIGDLAQENIEGLMFIDSEKYELVEVESKLLTVEEYAQNYRVDPKTVTQWIRRGKLRTSKKMGNAWMIPEMTDIPSRGYTTGYYLIKGDIRPLSDEYTFLRGITHVTTSQREKIKSEYLINCYEDDNPYPVQQIKYDKTELEKFELGLISHPNVLFIANAQETYIHNLIHDTRPGDRDK